MIGVIFSMSRRGIQLQPTAGMNPCFGQLAGASTQLCQTAMHRCQLGVEADEVTSPASFTDDLGADSLDIVELVMAFEEAFDMDIPDEDAEKITTVKDAIDYINNKKK